MGDLDRTNLTREDGASAYARVSTPDQSVAGQLEACVNAARQRGLTIAARNLYADVGAPGTSDSRPAFDLLRAAIRARRVSVVFVTKLDRVARSVRTALAFFEECEAAGTRVVVVEQQLDTATAAGRLVRTILAGVAEFEGELIRERTRAAMRALKTGARRTRSGRPVGRPRVVTDSKVRLVAALAQERLPTGQIAQRAGLKLGTVRWVLWALRAGKLSVDNPASEKPSDDRGSDPPPSQAVGSQPRHDDPAPSPPEGVAESK